MCGTYDERFNPDSISYTVPGMEAFNKQIEANVNQVAAAKTSLEKMEARRRTAYAAMQKLLTYGGSVLRRLRKKDPETVNDILHTLSKARAEGPRPSKPKNGQAAPPTPPGTDKEETRKRAAELRSFGNQLRYFNIFIDKLTRFAPYKPGDAAIKITALQTVAANLKKLNEGVVDCEADVNKHINERLVLLKTADDSLQNVVAGVKDYVKYVYGRTSNEYKQLVKFKFLT